MSFVKEKVSYLKGLSDGLNIPDETSRKLYSAIIDTLEAISEALDETEADIVEIDESISDIYDALDEIEDEIYGGPRMMKTRMNSMRMTSLSFNAR
ncbi:MAG TPA: hypothetical protein PLE79_04275, partial [Clostridia bacterium]|nr:hypothetical protein [Clostridia bacterium]